MFLLPKYDIVLLAYENEEEYTLKQALSNIKDSNNLKIGIIIGPEGGFDYSEVQELENAGAIKITLGKRILRTETVGMLMSSIIIYELE